MFIHSVYFWLRDDLTPAESDLFAGEVASLISLPTVRQGWSGPPAATDRPTIDSSYSCGLLVAFDDKQGHDAYQVDPGHLRFVETCSPLWTRVQVYDFNG